MMEEPLEWPDLSPLLAANNETATLLDKFADIDEMCLDFYMDSTYSVPADRTLRNAIYQALGGESTPLKYEVVRSTISSYSGFRDNMIIFINECNKIQHPDIRIRGSVLNASFISTLSLVYEYLNDVASIYRTLTNIGECHD